MGDANPIYTLGDYSKLAIRATGTPFNSPKGTMWTAKFRNDILMFQQHQGESLSEAWTHFKDLLQKVPHHGIDRWLQIQISYDHVSFHLKCEIDRAAGIKLCNKSIDESWEIIKNLALYDHEGWNDTISFVKPVKAISIPENTLKTPDRRLLELEDHINFLLKGSRPTARPCSTHTPQAYVNVREEINDKMAEMFGLLKELTTSRAPEKVLIKEEAKYPVTKNVNSISLTRGEEEKNDENDVTIVDDIEKTDGSDTEMLVKKAEKANEAENGTKNEPVKRDEREEVLEAPSS
ncbi:hypothetical protein Tco_0115075 [Tanacetum coccineum]